MAIKIYTKKGDKGETFLCKGEKVKKTFSLVHALGEVDELNSFVGVVRGYFGERIEEGEKTDEMAEKFFTILKRVQKDLYRIGADIVGVSSKEGPIAESDVTFLEETIDSLPCDVGQFVPPGAKGELSARLHVCRSVCRRAERSVLAAFDEICEGKLDMTTSPFVLQYLNRLSDLFFTMAEC